ncbi:MAG: PRC-barrel domain-containing protein [Patescibacteria group bacterium]
MFLFSPKSKLSARTKSGIFLGRVNRIAINPDDGRIREFIISSHHVIPRLLNNELIIAWNQILDWQEDEIIVADAAVPAEAAKVAFSQISGAQTTAHLSKSK